MSGVQPCAVAVREYVGSATSRAVIDLLDALQIEYVRHLRTCTVEELPAIQAKVAQCEQLERVLRAEPHADGRA